MKYDIRNVGDEYMLAESCYKNGDFENAIKHYQLAIDNYEYADNEEVMSPYESYVIILGDGTKESYPSINNMFFNSQERIRKIKKKQNKKESRHGILNSILSFFKKS